MRRIQTLVGVGLLSALIANGALAADTLRAVGGFPAGLIYAKTFKAFIDDVNRRGKGVVSIKFVGGPEAMPPLEQPNAVRNGIVDVFMGPANWYAGTVPEVEALIVSNGMTAPEVRARGGYKVLNRIHEKKMGVHYLANFNSGVPFHIYLRKKPDLAADRKPGLKGVRIRSAPIYREFFSELGMVPVQINIGEVYTALERGTADGTGWPAIGVMDLSWDKYLRYRIDPGFYQVETSIIVNLAKWRRLSEESRKLLTEIALRHEKKTAEDRQAQMKEELAEMEKRGMTIVDLSPEVAKKLTDRANYHAWKKIERRDPTNVKELQKYFDPPR